MWRYIWMFCAAFTAALAMTFVVPASPLYMPTTDCRPDEARYASLPFGASYEAVARHQGCRGIKASDVDLGGVLRKTVYVWRADSWPVGIVRLTFYNDTLQAASTMRLNLSVSLPH